MTFRTKSLFFLLVSVFSKVDQKKREEDMLCVVHTVGNTSLLLPGYTVLYNDKAFFDTICKSK